MKVKIHLTEADWLAARTGRIGASDMAVIAGAPKAFGSPYRLALRLRGELPQDEPSLAMIRGSCYEPAVVAFWQRTTGESVTHFASRTTVEDADAPLLATLDGIVGDPDAPSAVLEVKTAYYRHDDEDVSWGDDENDPMSVPLRTQVQCQTQMGLSGIPRARVLLDLGYDRVRGFWLDFDPAAWRQIRAAAVDFHAKVMGGWTPEPNARDLGIFKSMWPQDDGTEIDLPVEIGAAVEAYETAKAAITPLAAQLRTLERARDDAKAKIILGIGEAAAGTLPDGTRYELKTTMRKGYEVAETTLRTLRRK